MLHAISKLEYKGQYTDTSGGLHWAHAVLTDTKYGPRGPDVPKVIILITDGKQTPYKPDAMDAEHKKIIDANIKLIAIGITEKVSFIYFQHEYKAPFASDMR